MDPRDRAGRGDRAAILAMLTGEGDPAGLHVRPEGDRLVLTHQTCILVASRR